MNGAVPALAFRFFFTDPPTTEIYTLSLHDALPISKPPAKRPGLPGHRRFDRTVHRPDRKSTRLNSSHTVISYAVFCLKKKKTSSAAAVLLLSGASVYTRFVRLVLWSSVGIPRSLLA